MDYSWRVWSSYSLDVCHQGRIELPHFSGLVLQLGIVLLVFGSKGRTSTGYLQMMLSVVVSSIRPPCCSKALQADSGTNYSITVWADSQASKTYTALPVYLLAMELGKHREQFSENAADTVNFEIEHNNASSLLQNSWGSFSFQKVIFVLAITHLSIPVPSYLRDQSTKGQRENQSELIL